MSRTTDVPRFDLPRFATHILGVMRERRTSHEMLTAQTGLHLGLISRMARGGRRPTVDSFLALCHWAGANPMDFHLAPVPQSDPARQGAGSVFTWRPDQTQQAKP